MRDWLSLKRLCISASVQFRSGKFFGPRMLTFEQGSIDMGGNWGTSASPGAFIKSELNHDYHSIFRVFIRRKRREPGGVPNSFIVFVHDLSRAGLATNSQSVHVSFRPGTAIVFHVRQHGVSHDLKIARFNAKFIVDSAAFKTSWRNAGQCVLGLNPIDQSWP